jgi:hypothetical protein
VGDDSAGGATWQARVKRGGCAPSQPAGGAPAGSGSKPTGAGGAAQPCCVAGPNRGGQGADGWAPPTKEGPGFKL